MGKIWTDGSGDLQLRDDNGNQISLDQLGIGLVKMTEVTITNTEVAANGTVTAIPGVDGISSMPLFFTLERTDANVGSIDGSIRLMSQNYSGQLKDTEGAILTSSYLLSNLGLPTGVYRINANVDTVMHKSYGAGIGSVDTYFDIDDNTTVPAGFTVIAKTYYIDVTRTI